MNEAIYLIPILQIIISIVAIVATAVVTVWIAIYTIRKAAEKNRVSNIHAEMCDCLVETVSVFDEVVLLLDDIAKHVVYNSIPEERIVETAYIRYWREIGNLSNRFKKIHAKQKLVLPQKLCEDIIEIVQEMNDAKKIARKAVPDKKHIYPDTSELRKAVNTIATIYGKFVNCSREYLGTEKLEPIVMARETMLKAQENTN